MKTAKFIQFALLLRYKGLFGLPSGQKHLAWLTE
jgi:hypothetical protein